jgi:hypothetical protein
MQQRTAFGTCWLTRPRHPIAPVRGLVTFETAIFPLAHFKILTGCVPFRAGAVFSVDLCQASLHRLSRCGEANGWNPSACCHYSDFARQFCHNLEAYVESTFAGQVSMYLNASLSAPACKRHHNDGCMHAVRQLQSCANMYSGMPTGTGATPCCGSLYHVQSQCGNGDIFDTVQFLLELPFVELDVYSFGNMMDVVGRCPRASRLRPHSPLRNDWTMCVSACGCFCVRLFRG